MSLELALKEEIIMTRVNMTISEALNHYDSTGKHTSLLVGFHYHGYVYAISRKTLVKRWVKWQKNSSKRGSSWKLRLLLSDRDKEKLIKTAGCICLATYEDFFKEMNNMNRGEIFEKYICEAITGNPWKKDYTPWYEGADLEYGNLKVQIKYDGASIASLTSLLKN